MFRKKADSGEENTRVRPDIEEIRAGLIERERERERERDRRGETRSVGEISSSKVLIPERGA